MRRPSATAAALATAVLAASACSFIGVSGPPDDYDPRSMYPPPCTTTRAPAVLDTITAALIGGSGIYLYVTRDKGGQESEGFREGVGLLSLLPATVWALSAAFGYRAASSCRDAVRAHEQRAREKPR